MLGASANFRDEPDLPILELIKRVPTGLPAHSRHHNFYSRPTVEIPEALKSLGSISHPTALFGAEAHFSGLHLATLHVPNDPRGVVCIRATRISWSYLI